MNGNTDNTGYQCLGCRRYVPASLKLLLTLGAFSASSLLTANKLSAELQGLPPAASVNVIIQSTRAPSAADLKAVDRAGGVLKHSFQRIHGGLFALKTADQLNAIAANPNVAYVSLDRKVSGSLEF